MIERDRLDLVERRLGIQKMKLDVQKEKMNLCYHGKRKLLIEDQKLVIELIGRLNHILSDVTIDAENTILSSEPKYKCVLNDEEQGIVKDKIFQLLKNL